METEPDPPPPKPKARALQHLESHQDLGDLDENIHQSKPVPKKLPSGSKAVVLSKVKDKDRSKVPANPVSEWRSWMARHMDAEDEMEVDLPVNAGVGIVEKGEMKEGKGKEQKVKGKRNMSDQMLIISCDLLEIEIVEDGGKGKGKATEPKSVKAKFIVPPLPADKQPAPRPWKCSHQNLDNDWSTNSK